MSIRESGWLIKVNLDAYFVDFRRLILRIVVEQYRLLDGMIKIVQEVDATTGLPICNLHTCPTMVAGGYVEPAAEESEMVCH